MRIYENLNSADIHANEISRSLVTCVVSGRRACEEKQARSMRSRFRETERYCVEGNQKAPTLSAATTLGAPRSSAVIIHAERCRRRRDAINEAPGFMRAPGSCIASRRGRGIRLIILIAPSTPFLCGKCLAFARSLARSFARALPSRALNFMPLAAICTYKQTSESSCGAIRASVCVRIRTGGSHKRATCR